MAAPYGNRNAEKWTFKKAIQLFNEAIELSLKKEIHYLRDGKKTIKIEGYKYDFIGEIARDLELYKSIFTELKKKFPILKRKHKRLIETLEANCFCNAKKGNIKLISTNLEIGITSKIRGKIEKIIKIK